MANLPPKEQQIRPRNIMALLLLVVSFHISPVWLCADSENDSSPTLASENPHNLPNLANFKSRYLDQPTRISTTKTPLQEPALPPSLKVILANPNTRLLSRYMAVTKDILFEQCSLYDLPICFYANVSPNPPAQTLAGQLTTGRNYLLITHGVLDDLMAWLDWYPQKDWDKRFGKTGFFDQLSQYQQNLVLFDAAYWYYNSRSLRFTKRDTTPSKSKISKKLVSTNLEKYLEKLTAILENATIKQSNSQQLRLWQSRLYRELISIAPAYPKSPNSSEVRASIKNIAPDDFDGYLELLRLQFVQNSHSGSKISELLSKVKQFRLWLNQNSKSIKAITNKRLQLALFESMLQQNVIKHASSTLERQLLLDRSYLKSLKDMAQGFPAQRPVICDMIAQHLMSSLKAVSQSTASFSLDDFLKTCDDFELQLLAEHYQSGASPDIFVAISIYQSFLKNRNADHPDYPLVLYRLGLCNYQLIAQAKEGDTQKANKHTKEAIIYWHKLADEYPGFSTSHNKQTISAQEAISLAASLSWSLYAQDNATYSQLTHTVLATLVGKVAPGQLTPTGPFAKSDSARIYRYFYGQSLQDAKRYQQAADIFATVGIEDKNYFQAVYQQAYCSYQCLESQGNSSAQLKLRYQPLIDKLKKLINNHLDNPISVNLTILLDKLCRKTENTAQMIIPVSNVLEARSDNAELVNLAMKLLSDQWPGILQSHGQGDRGEFPIKLANSLHLARLTYGSFDGKVKDEKYPLAFKLLLEYLAVSSANVSNGASVRDLVSLMSRVDMLLQHGRSISGFSKQIWFVRAEALLLFSKGNYAKSRKLWHTIRSSTKPTADTRLGYYWWESRYYSLCCLEKLKKPDQIQHVIDVLLKSYPNSTTPWRGRIEKMSPKNSTDTPNAMPES